MILIIIKFGEFCFEISPIINGLRSYICMYITHPQKGVSSEFQIPLGVFGNLMKHSFS